MHWRKVYFSGLVESRESIPFQLLRPVATIGRDIPKVIALLLLLTLLLSLFNTRVYKKCAWCVSVEAGKYRDEDDAGSKHLLQLETAFVLTILFRFLNSLRVTWKNLLHNGNMQPEGGGESDVACCCCSRRRRINMLNCVFWRWNSRTNKPIKVRIFGYERAAMATLARSLARSKGDSDGVKSWEPSI